MAESPHLTTAETRAAEALAAHRPTRGVDPLGTHGRRARIALTAAAPSLIVEALQIESTRYRTEAINILDTDPTRADALVTIAEAFSTAAHRVLTAALAQNAATLAAQAARMAEDFEPVTRKES